MSKHHYLLLGTVMGTVLGTVMGTGWALDGHCRRHKSGIGIVCK